ncbi:MAG: hypothetical protein J6P07_08145 [Spirochaetaceae bacterium]|nr:hypothetical protein [Spirochaetaceae bacterium]
MTEEEKLAEEYANKFRDDNILHFGENLIDLTLVRKYSFLDGLKEGKKIAIKEMTQNLGEAMNTWI